VQILAIVIGVTFINQPNTTAGGFTRGSVIFLGALTSFGVITLLIAPTAAMLLNCLNAFVEMPLQMLGRPILYKQTDFKFFRPSALPLANTLADIPFSFTRILIFNIIVRIYFTRRSIKEDDLIRIFLGLFASTPSALVPVVAKRLFASLTNLSRSAGAFFTFQMLVYISFLVMQGFFRLLGILCNNFDQAFRLGSFFIPNMILYAGASGFEAFFVRRLRHFQGYIIPVFRLQRWLFWIVS